MKPRNTAKHDSEITGLINAVGDYVSTSFEAYRTFVITVMQLGELTEEEAEIVWVEYNKAKALKFDRVNRRYTVKHGALLDKDTLKNTAKAKS
jgi:hypothetical protein